MTGKDFGAGFIVSGLTRSCADRLNPTRAWENEAPEDQLTLRRMGTRGCAGRSLTVQSLDLEQQMDECMPGGSIDDRSFNSIEMNCGHELRV